MSRSLTLQHQAAANLQMAAQSAAVLRTLAYKTATVTTGNQATVLEATVQALLSKSAPTTG